MCMLQIKSLAEKHANQVIREFTYQKHDFCSDVEKSLLSLTVTAIGYGPYHMVEQNSMNQ